MSRTHDARGAVENHCSGATGAPAVVVGGSMAGLLAARVLANRGG
jgi:alpha-D-ribose 1-methylphosphonate 5-triphosphate diphosphatase PhnM